MEKLFKAHFQKTRINNIKVQVNGAILLVLALSGCNSFSNHMKQEWDKGMEEEKKEWLAQEDIQEKEYTAAYKHYLAGITNDSLKKDAFLLDASIHKGGNYFDSVTRILDGLDIMDPNNTRYVGAIFISKWIADTIYEKLQFSNSLAHKISLIAGNTARVDSLKNTVLKESDVGAWKDGMYFNSLGPAGAIVMMHYYKSELLLVGKACMKK